MPAKSKRPFVYLNLAMTADGKIATANRAITTFGSDKDSDQFYKLRSTADAIMSGARTVDTLPVTLGNGGEKYRKQRVKNGMGDHALRVIVSGSASLNPDAEIFKHRFSPIILLTSNSAPKSRLKKLFPLVDDIGQFGANELDIVAALQWLHQKWEVNRFLCEGGADVNDLLFRADVVDEINLTICPFVFGGRTAPTLSEGIGLPKLAEARQFELKSMNQAGDELFAVFRRKKSS
ncbi:MAG TPA: dihydrofolate reductase family protein [Verrucomicrobiae bacterium]